jgi:predicted Zn-dependent peptidase
LSDYHYHRLQNGIRVIHKPSEGKVAHVGFVINTGSRDEQEGEQGIAHLIEHVIFKGTQKRKAYHVISRLEDVGGELDAYTTKEETCIYAAFLKEYYPRTLELFADIMFHSTFPEKEVEKEKEVIIDEINSYKDSPGDLIFDDFEDLIFMGHPIGRNILGTPESLANFNKNDIQRFMARTYATDQMVICSVGNVPFKAIMHWVEKFFGSVPENRRTEQRTPVNGYTSQVQQIKMETHQAHCIIGCRAYAIDHPRRLSLELLNNILGGPGMNSRLNLALRERHGYTYNIESFYNPYTDTGTFGIYFGTDEGKIEKSLKIIRSELKKLQQTPLGILQLDRAKKQIMGQMAIGAENYSSLMLNLGRSYLLFDKVDSLETIYEKVNKLTANELQETAIEMFNPEDFSILTFA